MRHETAYCLSSRELKAQVSFSDQNVSSVVNFHFFLFSSRTNRPISTKLGTKHLWVKGPGIQVCSEKGDVLFQGEIITK